MRVLIKIRLKVGCGIGAEGDDSSAKFFLWIKYYTQFRELEIYNCISEKLMI